jgi:iron complex outermembrane receptor protein
VTRAVTIKQPKGDSSFVVNGRLSLAEIPAGGADLEISVWARNLLDEEHLFYKSLSDRTGTAGFFNEPRTFGIEVKVKN